MENDILGSHIHGEQFKKVTEDGVFGKERKEQMGLASLFGEWKFCLILRLVIVSRVSFSFVFFFARYTCTN